VRKESKTAPKCVAERRHAKDNGRQTNSYEPRSLWPRFQAEQGRCPSPPLPREEIARDDAYRRSFTP
jgi:hypothetical protein